jgi:ribose 5-phosphate isomerase B
MAIVANKVRGVRAAAVHDPFSAARSRRSNNAQIMTVGKPHRRAGAGEDAGALWLDSEFEGGRSARKVDKITAGETKVTES